MVLVFDNACISQGCPSSMWLTILYDVAHAEMQVDKNYIDNGILYVRVCPISVE